MIEYEILDDQNPKVSNTSKSISVRKLTPKEVESNRSSACPYTL